jgi:hypothetical protein
VGRGWLHSAQSMVGGRGELVVLRGNRERVGEILFSMSSVVG